MKTNDILDIPVSGGALRAGRWAAADPAAPVILAAHGVTANHVSWRLVGEFADATVVAADLRGRGRSSAVAGTAGMARHAADLLAVADQIGAERVVVAGHSMGGFVVSAFHELHPDRTAGVVLVDGGLPFPPPPPGGTAEKVLADTIGPAAKRLTMTFESVADYLAFWRDDPALSPSWSPAIEDYLRYDLAGEAARYRSSVTVESVREDSQDILDADMSARRARGLPAGSVFLRAPYDLLGAFGGLYPAELMARHTVDFPNIDMREIAGTNHYTILMAEPGARAVAAVLDEVAGRRG